jgi:hypothetical protein
LAKKGGEPPPKQQQQQQQKNKIKNLIIIGNAVSILYIYDFFFFGWPRAAAVRKK